MPIRVPYNPARFVRLSVWNGRGVGLLIAAAMANGCSAGPLAEPMVTVASKPEVVTVASHMPLEPLPKIQRAAVVAPALDVETKRVAEKPTETMTPRPTMIAPPPPPYSTVEYPTIIHPSSSVAIAIPKTTDLVGGSAKDSASNSSESLRVVLRKVSVPGGQPEWIEGKVKRGRCAFPNLKDGAYDVFYVSSAMESGDIDAKLASRHPQRRIIVEGARASLLGSIRTPVGQPEPLHAGVEVIVAAATEKTAFDGTESDRPSLGDAVTIDAVQNQSNRGWELLAKRSYYSALDEFQAAIHEVGQRLGEAEQGLSGRQVTSDWQKMLDGKTEIATQIRSEQINPIDLASKLAGYVGNQPRMAATFHGLARTYDEISRGPRPLIRDAEGLAVLAYMTAMALDPSDSVAANDLGALCYRLGWLEKAKSSLEYAATNSPRDAVAAYNLGRVCWESGEPLEAEKWWQEAISRDPDFAPAHLEYARCVLRSGGLALYPEDCRKVAESLGRVSQLHSKGSPEAVWATSVLNRLELVGRELSMNDEGLIHRQWIARLGHHDVAKVQLASRPQQTRQQAATPAHVPRIAIATAASTSTGPSLQLEPVKLESESTLRRLGHIQESKQKGRRP